MIVQKMALTNIHNRSAYIKKMCIDGYVINLDTPMLTEIGRLLRITSGNVNQIAKRVNWSGTAYREDIAEVVSQLADIREMFGQVLHSLAKIK